MTCDERRDLILLCAADAVEPPEREELRAHLRSGCPRCAGGLAEAETVLAQLPLALAPVAPSPQVRQRLLARVESEEATVPRGILPAAAFPRVKAPARSFEKWIAPFLAAGLAAAAVYGLVVAPLSEERASLRAELATQSDRLRSLETIVEEQTETARLLQSRESVVAMLAGAEPQPEAWGRILWDREHRTIRFYTGNLKPLEAGRTYELWLITDGQEKIPAGTFDVDSLKHGLLVTRLAQDVGNVVVAAVTDEPTGGVAQPTGSIQLAGKLNPAG